MRELETLAKTSLDEIRIIFIAKTDKKEMFEWNLAQSRISSCVWIDEKGLFEQSNFDHVYLNLIALIGENNEILTEGDLTSDKTKLTEFISNLNDR